jgi:hypothetical protein
MEIETERSARSRADKRAEMLEKRLETQQMASAIHVEELVGLRTLLNHARQEVERLRIANAEERAESEATATQAAMARLLPLLNDAKPKRAATKERKQAAG